MLRINTFAMTSVDVTIFISEKNSITISVPAQYLQIGNLRSHVFNAALLPDNDAQFLAHYKSPEVESAKLKSGVNTALRLSIRAWHIRAITNDTENPKEMIAKDCRNIVQNATFRTNRFLAISHWLRHDSKPTDLSMAVFDRVKAGFLDGDLFCSSLFDRIGALESMSKEGTIKKNFDHTTKESVAKLASDVWNESPAIKSIKKIDTERDELVYTIERKTRSKGDEPEDDEFDFDALWRQEDNHAVLTKYNEALWEKVDVIARRKDGKRHLVYFDDDTSWSLSAAALQHLRHSGWPEEGEDEDEEEDEEEKETPPSPTEDECLEIPGPFPRGQKRKSPPVDDAAMMEYIKERLADPAERERMLVVLGVKRPSGGEQEDERKEG
jgi:hypothetical protein